MKTSRNSFVADVAFIMLLLLLFITTLFMAMNPERLAFNVIALLVVFAVMLITRFTSLTAGLIVNIVVVFLYMTWLIYDSIANGVGHGIEAYLWALLMPLLTAASGVMCRSTHQIEQEYGGLQDQVQNYATIDRDTGLKTQFAYAQELEVFQSLARRGNMQVLLIVWCFRFDKQIKRMLSERELHNLVLDISDATREAFRKEDVLYVLQKDPILWGTVTLVTPGNADKMIARMREKVEAIDMREMLGKRAPKVELRIGARHDEKNEMEPDKMLEGAIAQMQYDV